MIILACVRNKEIRHLALTYGIKIID